MSVASFHQSVLSAIFTLYPHVFEYKPPSVWVVEMSPNLLGEG
jgi:hypothetical protein